MSTKITKVIQSYIYPIHEELEKGFSRLGKSCLHKYNFFEKKDDNKHCESNKSNGNLRCSI